MLDRIQGIDTGAIEELTRIRRNQEILEDRLRLMGERRDGVSEVVFERVRSDYRSRLDALDEQARPLKETARREYAKLAQLRGELQSARDEAQLEKEEVDFRNGLGEFAADEYERRAADCTGRVSARDDELAEVETLRERFFGACRSPEELEGAAELEPTVAAAPPGEALEAPEVLEALEPLAELPASEPAAMWAQSRDAAVEEPFAPRLVEPEMDEAAAVAPLLADQDSAAEAPPPPFDYPFDSGATSRMDSDLDLQQRLDEDATILNAPAAEELDASGAGDDFHEAITGSFETPLLPPPSPSDFEEEDEDELSGATRILVRPRLVELDNGASGREHPLALGRTSIGRASDNLVHLLDEAVSRHHAEVVPGPDGYLLRDLSSENGIFVNGERAPEHVLREGDLIQIGARTLVFHGA